MRKVAVTGGVATGKSTACQILKEFGAYVISADDIVHQLLSPETDVGKKVIALLGRGIVVDETIQRDRISEVVFQNKPLLDALEKLLHPEVQKIIDSQYRKISKEEASYSLFVAEVPLLFEARLEEYYDYVLLIVATEAHCQNRFLNKGFSQTEYANRQSRFILSSKKISHSDYVIENEGSYDDFKISLFNVYQELIKEI